MIEKMSGKQQEMLKEPEVNPAAAYLLETFLDLGTTRTSGMNGNLNGITYAEIKAYVDLTGTDLEPWEVEIIKMLDRTYVQAVYKERNDDTQE